MNCFSGYSIVIKRMDGGKESEQLVPLFIDDEDMPDILKNDEILSEGIKRLNELTNEKSI